MAKFAIPAAPTKNVKNTAYPRHSSKPQAFSNHAASGSLSNGGFADGRYGLIKPS
jgi:hypothetical protein